MAKKAVFVGIGSWGEWWCRDFLPPMIEEGRLEIAAVADLDPGRFELARHYLHIDSDRCYTDAEQAFREREADFAIIVVPPHRHEEIVDLALRYGMDILSEKPVADTLEGAVRIARKVKQAGRKMAVTMSHRYDQDKTTLRREIRSGKWGRLDYLVSRFTCNLRQFGSWGEFRHRMQNPLLTEGSVHHLDILADLAGAPCETLYAAAWKPEWAEYAGDCNALVQMTFRNGTHALYEGAKSNAVTLNGWAHEYIRAECEGGTLVMDQRQVGVYPYRGFTGITGGPGALPEPVALIERPRWANAWLLEQFIDWLEGGKTMETNVESNLQSVALVEAAILSSRTGQPVQVQKLLDQVKADIV